MSDNTSYWCEKTWLGEDWASDVRIEVSSDGFITAVSANETHDNAEYIAGVVLPGMPNLHSHAFQRAAAGLTEQRVSGQGNDDSFWTWREIMHSFCARLTPEDNMAIAAQLYVEMLKAGYTAVGEFHYLHRDPEGRAYGDPCEMGNGIIKAAERVGIGLTLLPVLYSVGGYGVAVPNKGQRRYILEVDEFLNLVRRHYKAHIGNSQVCIGIAPHSVRQVPAQPLTEALNEFRDLSQNGPVHIHAAEQERDVEEHMKYSGDRPISWLLNNMEIDCRWCLVHATHMNKDETTGLAKSGAVVGLCPSTEANLGDGFFPFSEYLSSEGKWGIGSDSHVSINPWEELRWLEYGQRLKAQSRNIAAVGTGGSTGLKLFSDALIGGAQALGRPIGKIAVGKRADFIVLDSDYPQLYSRNGERFFDSLIFSNNSSPIRHVMCGGRWVVRDSIHPEEKRIFADFRDVILRLMTEPL